MLGIGYSPARLQLNVQCGAALNAAVPLCEPLPVGTSASLQLSYPLWELTVAATVTPTHILIHLDEDQVRRIPRAASARLWITTPGADPVIWRSGCVRFGGGCC